MVASGAYAADLPGEAAPAAVDYVKVCDAYGAGFFYIPGTQTCMEIGGRVRSWLQYNTADGADDTLKFGADGRVFIDTRTASDFGTVRSYFRFKSKWSDADGRADIALDQAYLQVGMLTVGYAGSFYGDGYIGYSDDGYSIGEDKTRLRVRSLLTTSVAASWSASAVTSRSTPSRVTPLLTTCSASKPSLAFRVSPGVRPPWSVTGKTPLLAPTSTA
jgi:hypothetical protein